MVGFDAVKQVMLNFYTSLLGKTNHIRCQLDQNVIAQGPILNPKQQLGLCKGFTLANIKEVFFSIPNTKSPGPDGFSSGFYKSACPTIGPLVCAAIQDFFSTGQLPSSISATKLILLPKVHSLRMPQIFALFLVATCYTRPFPSFVANVSKRYFQA